MKPPSLTKKSANSISFLGLFNETSVKAIFHEHVPEPCRSLSRSFMGLHWSLGKVEVMGTLD